MIFADKRYNQSSKRNKLPPWVTQFLQDSNTNLSTEEAVTIAKQFLRELSQPISMFSSQNELNKTMLFKEDLNQYLH